MSCFPALPLPRCLLLSLLGICLCAHAEAVGPRPSGTDSSVLLWDASGRQLRVSANQAPETEVLPEGTARLLASPDGRRLLHQGRDGTLSLRTVSGSVLKPLGSGGSVLQSFSGDSDALAWSSQTEVPEVRVARAPAWKVHRLPLPAGTQAVTALAWDGSGKLMAALQLATESRIEHLEASLPGLRLSETVSALALLGDHLYFARRDSAGLYRVPADAKTDAQAKRIGDFWIQESSLKTTRAAGDMPVLRCLAAANPAALSTGGCRLLEIRPEDTIRTLVEDVSAVAHGSGGAFAALGQSRQAAALLLGVGEQPPAPTPLPDGSWNLAGWVR